LKKFLPATLKTQTLLIFFAMFIISHIAGFLIYEMSRSRTVLLTEAVDLAARIAGIVDLAHDFQGAERSRILSAAQTQFLAMYPDVTMPEEGECLENEFAASMLDEFQSAFSDYPGLGVDVCVRNLYQQPLPRHFITSPGFDVLFYINFPDGQQYVFHAILPEGPSLFTDIALAYIIFVGVISLLVGWYLILRIIAPLDRLAQAADRIGVNIDAPALDEEGTEEIQTAARAFNRMQDRLQRLVHGQTEMIAAISHDLRSAVTRLRLRSELLEDAEERGRFVRVVEDMDLMVRSVIDFLRGIDTTEELRKIRISALLESLCQDLKEEGCPVSFCSSNDGMTLQCRPAALRRCFVNIINNAVKYGGAARITLATDEEQAVIRIEDDGPGVPEHEFSNIVRPFYRIEHSRNLETGGLGLGLAIALNIIQVHGGMLSFSNRPEGGLRVEIRLGLSTKIQNCVRNCDY